MGAVADYRIEQNALTRLAARDLIRFWSALPDLSSRQVAYDSVRELFGTIVNAYGEQAALSAERYVDAHREELGVKLPAPVLGQLPPEKQLDRIVSWHLRDLTPETGNQVRSNLTGSLVRMVLEGSRSTISESTRKANTRFARATDGDPCPWCAMLAGRGAVYLSKSSALVAKDGDRYHDFCGCSPIEVIADDDLPEENRVLEQLWREHARAGDGLTQQQAWTAYWDSRDAVAV